MVYTNLSIFWKVIITQMCTLKSLGYFCSLNQCGTYIKGKSVEASTLFPRPYLFTAHKYLSSTSFFAVKIFSGVGVFNS